MVEVRCLVSFRLARRKAAQCRSSLATITERLSACFIRLACVRAPASMSDGAGPATFLPGGFMMRPAPFVLISAALATLAPASGRADVTYTFYDAASPSTVDNEFIVAKPLNLTNRLEIPISFSDAWTYKFTFAALRAGRVILLPAAGPAELISRNSYDTSSPARVSCETTSSLPRAFARRLRAIYVR